jgi:hypothetical protein
MPSVCRNTVKRKRPGQGQRMRQKYQKLIGETGQAEKETVERKVEFRVTVQVLQPAPSQETIPYPSRTAEMVKHGHASHGTTRSKY